MREVSIRERQKRGCLYCADCSCGSGKHTKCPYDKCPYHELDGFKSYEAYLKKSKKGGLGRLLEALSKKCDIL